MTDDIKLYHPGLNNTIRSSQKQLLYSNIDRIKKNSCSILISEELFRNISLILIPIVDNNNKIGFVDNLGNIVITPIYDKIKGAFRMEQDVVAASRNKRWTVIDIRGKELLPCKFTTIWPSKDSCIVSLQTYSGWSVMDVHNDEIIIPEGEYNYIEGFRYGYARVKKNGLWGVINAIGKVVIPAEYKDMLDFYENWDKPETKVRKSEDDEWEHISLLDL